MPPRANIASVLVIACCVLAGGLFTVGIAGAFLCRTDLWLIGMRGGLSIIGPLGLVYGALVGRAWFAWWGTRDDATHDRSANPLPLPAELLPAQTELLNLGFIPVGQTETKAGAGKAPMIGNVLLAPSDPRIVASLSFSRTRTSFGSYLPDGRVIETGYPPLGLADVKMPKGWRLLPGWLQAYECADGVEAALALQRAHLEFEAVHGCPALAIPGYPTVVYWENLALRQIRSFYQQQLWRQTRSVLWIVPLGLVFTWAGIFATWR
jgi:hypothetical protein